MRRAVDMATNSSCGIFHCPPGLISSFGAMEIVCGGAFGNLNLSSWSFSVTVILMFPCFRFPVSLIPSAPTERRPLQGVGGGDGVDLAKSRKRVFPATHPPGPNSLWDPHNYCNTPNHSEQAWEGETHREEGSHFLCVRDHKSSRVLSLFRLENPSWRHLSSAGYLRC